VIFLSWLLTSVLFGVEVDSTCPVFRDDSLRWEAEIDHDRRLGLVADPARSRGPSEAVVPWTDTARIHRFQRVWDAAVRDARGTERIRWPRVPSTTPRDDWSLALLWTDVESFGYVKGSCWHRFQCEALQRKLDAASIPLRVCRSRAELDSLVPRSAK